MTYSVAVVGATGAVGEELLTVLRQRQFPLDRLSLFASPRSAGRRVAFGPRDCVVAATDAAAVAQHDLVFLSAGASLSQQLRPALRDSRVYDNSSAFRMDPEVPLVVPEVNPDAMTADHRYVAVPNCTAILLVLALAPLARAFGLRRVIVSTYQAASGAGRRAVAALESDCRSDPAVLDRDTDSLAFNVIPWIGTKDGGAVSGEEQKLIAETRRILGLADFEMTATCVRVPVIRAHSESVVVELDNQPTLEEFTAVLGDAPGVELKDDPIRGIYPTPRAASGIDGIQLGRIRTAGRPGCFAFFLAGDQLRKGAALNAVQIAERQLDLGAES